MRLPREQKGSAAYFAASLSTTFIPAVFGVIHPTIADNHRETKDTVSKKKDIARYHRTE